MSMRVCPYTLVPRILWSKPPEVELWCQRYVGFLTEVASKV